MKPCARNQKALSLLAINALGPQDEAELRAHIETCDDCRAYVREILNVAGRFSPTPSEFAEGRPSDAFHRKLVRRIESEGGPGTWARIWDWMMGAGLGWKPAVGVAGIAVVVAALVVVPRQRENSRKFARALEPPVVTEMKREKQVEQTFGSYRMLANRSLDLLDQELTDEAKKSPSGAPPYTMASLVRVMGSD